MQTQNVLLVLPYLCLLAGCGANESPHEEGVVTQTQTTAACAPLTQGPVTAITYNNEPNHYWKHAWAESELTLTPNAGWVAWTPGSRDSEFEDNNAPVAGVPKDLLGGGIRLNKPYSAGSPKDLIAISEYQTDEAMYVSHQVRILSRQNLKSISTIKSKHWIRSLALSPEGTHVVILGAESVPHEKHFLDSVGGHSIPFYNLYLTVFALDGNQVCETVLDKDMPYITGFVKWGAVKNAGA